jgi:shikimate kinase
VGFRDTDHDIEAATGQTVSDLFVQRGEPYFRTLEREAVAKGLAEHEGVLSLGAGAILSADVRESLLRHQVVHLDVGLAAAMQRLEMNRSRPLLIGNVRGRWQELANERRPLYLEVATVTVATDGMSPADVVEAVVAALSKGAEQ